MKEIKLLGEAADIYGESFAMDVRTPSEALRALEANFSGFLKYMDDNDYRFVMVDFDDPDNSSLVDKENTVDSWGNKIMFAVPSAEGNPPVIAAIALYAAAYAGTAATILGVSAVYIGTIILVTEAVVTIALTLAVSMAASAIASAIFGSDSKSSTFEAPESKPSYIFNGVVNTMKQGGRLPLLYGGPILVGSMTLSARIITEDIPV